MTEQKKLDKEYIKSLIQIILNDNHSIQEKKSIIEHRDRLNFACPICGDSIRHSGKKRGNLYFKNMYYVCYNEESCSRSITNLLKTFNIDMDLDKKLELYEYIENNINYYNPNDVQFDNLNKLFSLDDILKFFGGNNKTVKLTNLRPLQKGSIVERHIRETRKIYRPINIYEGIMNITPKWKEPVMVFLNMVNDKVISFQTRNLLEGDDKRFKIFDFSMIYEYMYPEENLDDQEKISYDKLSHFFNIFNVDFTQPVNLFEGYVDSLFLSNSIGQIGINTDLSFLLKEEGIDFRFVYDNDLSGNKKAIKMLNNGYKIFLWNKFFIDILKKYKGNDLPGAVEKLKKIKDFNELSTKFKQPIEKIFLLEKYFSNNDLDKIYLNDLDKIYKVDLGKVYESVGNKFIIKNGKVLRREE
jgi:hypothetical protein